MKALLLITAAMGGSALAESAIPSPHQRDRYQETYTTSPFALATPEEKPPEAPVEDEFANLVVTGLGKLDDGRSFVVVRRAGEESSMRFEGTDPNREGYAVKEVKWAEKWGQTSVVLSKGTKQGTVKFNENLSASAPPPPNPGGQRPPNIAGGTPPPIVPTGLNNANRPTTMQKGPPGSPNIPRPTSQIPRPGGGAQLPNGTQFRNGATFTAPPGTQAGGVSTNSGAPRQRVRTINNR